MEKLIFAQMSRGICLTNRRQRLRLTYPPGVWQGYPRAARAVLTDHLAHLLTINMPLISGARAVRYNTGVPALKPFFDAMAIGGIPGAVESYRADTDQTIRQFLNTRYVFDGSQAREAPPRRKTRERAVVALSCGKDSLLTLAVCRELGLDPVPMYVNDTISPTENRLKLRSMKRLAKEFGLDLQVVTNEIEQINDFEKWGADEGLLGYMHMLTGFCLMALPIAHRFRARYIMVGNQQNMNFGFVNKDGYETWPSFDQTGYWTRRQDTMVQMLSGGGVRLMSVIEPLTNIPIMWLLFNRYPEIAKYLVCCDCLNASDEKRWCHDCNKCARLQMMIRAVGGDPRTVGFHDDLLATRFRKHYRLFRGREVDSYETSSEARDEQLLAFLMAWRTGTRGPMMSRFEKEFLAEARRRERELRRKFLRLYDPTTMPAGLGKRVLGLYKKALAAC